MLESLQKIKIKKPVDLIIDQIRDLILSGALKAGDKLPPERKLAKQLDVSRGQIREAITKLQIYGILKVHPQSGSIVSGMGTVALEGLFTNILQIEKTDFESLVETRILLEKEAARLAALNRTDDDLKELKNALDLYEQKLQNQEVAVEEDLLFHLKLAEAGKNTVLKSLMMIITPEIVKSFIENQVCGPANNLLTIREHRAILEMIIQQDSAGAEKAMMHHLRDIKNFKKNNIKSKVAV